MAPAYAVQLSLLDLLLSSPEEPVGGSPDPSGGDGLATIIDLHREPASVAHQWSSGVGGRIRDNIAAIRALRDTEQDGQERTAKLARFSGWGGLGAIFEDPRFSDELAELSLLVGDGGLAHARTSILNAHYTDSGIATAMWKAMLDLGLDRGPVIEPGCGAGVFIAGAPSGVDVVGVELDPTAGAIADALHPGAAVVIGGFESYSAAAGSFAGGIGNVPFGDYGLFDPRYNARGRTSIHNHFLLKTVDLVAPGGLIALITSHFSMDARSPGTRRALAERAELLGAVRLPSGSHRKAANTEVVMDILVMRRRRDGEGGGEEFEGTVAVAGDGGEAQVNQYFVSHPEQVLGELVIERGPYSRADVVVHGDLSRVVPDVEAALQRITGTARAAGKVFAFSPGPTSPAREALDNGPGLAAKSLVVTGDGFGIVTGGGVEPYACRPRADAAELRELIGLRDCLCSLLRAQSVTAEDDDFAALQEELNQRYDAYVEKYGPLSRYEIRATSRVDEDGEPVVRVVYPSMGGFRSDPLARSVLALENYDAERKIASKAPIFFGRVVRPAAIATGAENPQDAVALSLSEKGRIDLGYVALLLGVGEAEAEAEIGDLAYRDPATGQLVPAAAYLSGDVVTKLDLAREAAQSDPSFERNVSCLEAVVPERIPASDIYVHPGAAWMPKTVVIGFCNDVLGVESVKFNRLPDGTAQITTGWGAYSPANTTTYGVKWTVWDGIKLLVHAMNGSPVQITETIDGKTKVNVEKTLLALEKQRALLESFTSYCVATDEQREVIEEAYNSKLNRLRVQRYDGSHLAPVGLSAHFSPRDFQLDAVWRILTSETVLLGHQVGAGKTAMMVMAGMEMIRLGLCRRPAYVVPNHLVEQFAAEFIQLYPSARILVAPIGASSTATRVELATRLATDEFDAVIFSQSVFSRIPLDPDWIKTYVDKNFTAFRETAAIRYGVGSVKALKMVERAVAGWTGKLLAGLDRVGGDPGPTFDALGIDYLFIDEAAAYKNRAVSSAHRELNCAGSLRALDLDAKMAWLREMGRERVATFATATPVANSLAEVHSMMTYLAPQVLGAASVDIFDLWAATFAEAVSMVEMNPTGKGFRLRSRFARFVNLPEFVTMLAQVLEIGGSEELVGLVPKVVGDKPEVVIVPRSDELGTYIDSLVERAESLSGGKGERENGRGDNMLVITGDGRKAALDLHLVGIEQPSGGKIETVAREIVRIHDLTKDNVYLDSFGRTSPVRGGLQLVFCDLSTPSSAWNAYDELRQRLVEAGIGGDKVAFIHDAKDPVARERLFESCRNGGVSVLVGSTEKMGLGTNIQDRAVAIHHMDCPWRPCDLEQRNGRLVRQGNQNSEVRILNYAVEQSFDVYMWQTVERKSRFISQVLRQECGLRTMEDLDEATLSYAEVKALAAGNPLVMEKVAVDSEVMRLFRLRRAHDGMVAAAKHEAGVHRVGVERALVEIAQLETALDTTTPIDGDSFVIEVDGRSYTDRREGGTALIRAADGALGSVHGNAKLRPVIGRLAGLDIVAQFSVGVNAGALRNAQVAIVFGEIPSVPKFHEIGHSELDGLGLIASLSATIRGLPARLEKTREVLARLQVSLAVAERNASEPFNKADELAAAIKRRDELADALAGAADVGVAA